MLTLALAWMALMLPLAILIGKSIKLADMAGTSTKGGSNGIEQRVERLGRNPQGRDLEPDRR